MLSVQVEAPDETDATEALSDCFGEGTNCGLEVIDFEVTDHEVLS
jgi:hypothetical protein